jgi:O-antigen/teichoic acid export membrane protein
MIPVLQLLCGVGMVQSIGTLNGNLYQAMGRTDLQLRVGGTVGVAGVVAISLGIWMGDIISVALAYTIFSAIVTYPSIHFAVSVVGLRVGDLATNLFGIFGCATVMAGCVYLLKFALPPEWPHILRLITQVSAGVLLYWGLVYGFGVQAYEETVDLLYEQIQ